MSTVLRSQIRCPECGELIASIHRHDFRSCGCGATSIDGGRDYLRVLGDNGFENESIIVERELSMPEGRLWMDLLKALSSLKTAADHASTEQVVTTAIEQRKRLWGDYYDAQYDPSHASARDALTAMQEERLVASVPLATAVTGWRSLVELAEHPDV